MKQSKTKEILEWNGRVYERAVYEFDQQAGQVNEYCERLPESKEHHQRELLQVDAFPDASLARPFFQWFGLLYHHHKQCAVVIADNLAKHGNPRQSDDLQLTLRKFRHCHRTGAKRQEIISSFADA